MRCIIYIQLTLFLVCFRAPLPYCSALASLSLHCTHKIHPQLPLRTQAGATVHTSGVSCPTGASAASVDSIKMIRSMCKAGISVLINVKFLIFLIIIPHK